MNSIGPFAKDVGVVIELQRQGEHLLCIALVHTPRRNTAVYTNNHARPEYSSRTLYYIWTRPVTTQHLTERVQQSIANYNNARATSA